MLEPRLPFADAFTEEAELALHDCAHALQLLRHEAPEVLAQVAPYIHEICETAADLARTVERMH